MKRFLRFAKRFAFCVDNKMEYDDYVIIQVLVGTISNALNIWQFLLIRNMQLNGFLILILALSVSSFSHDSVYYFQLAGTHWGKGVSSLLALYTGCMMGIWTNIMSLTLYRIVNTLQSVNITSEFPYYVVIAFFAITPWAIYSVVTNGWTTDAMTLTMRVYYYILWSEIVVNFLLYASTIRKTRLLQIQVEENKLSKKQYDYIVEIVGRMRFYGLTQIVSRAGTIWYNFDADTTKSVSSRYVHAILGPICGILYFAVFLYVQPSARVEVLKQCHRVGSRLCCMMNIETETASENLRTISHDSARISGLSILSDADDLMFAVDEEEKLRQSASSISNNIPGTYGDGSKHSTPDIELCNNPILVNKLPRNTGATLKKKKTSQHRSGHESSDEEDEEAIS